MGAFEYTALDGRGHERKGVVEGDTPRQVRQQLREQGLTPLAINAAAEQESKSSGGFRLRRGISASDLALITRQLATLIRSAMPVEEALLVASQQCEKARLKSMLLAVRSRVMEGHTLAYGLSQFSNVFPEIFRATVAAGEHSGHLDGVLERLADYAENRQLLRQKMTLAMIYPTILTIMAVVVVAGLMAYVVPRVTQVYAHTGQSLPFLTIALIAISHFLHSYGIYLIIALGVVAFMIRRSLKSTDVRRRWDHYKLRMPLIGRLVRGINTSQFTRTLSILAGSGVPVLDALRISGEVVVNVPMREAVDEAALRVREGASISQSLSRSGLFPPMAVHLIASGESSGKLDSMLERAAISQERELETLTGTLLGIMEPALILVMGVIVLLIVLGILLPIFNLDQMVH
ncbi:MAG: type II secretion system inner membrane protein GspF [Gammaproteobacteria bacterium]|nr:type II secretion system inner membrane protein GspF [Gammaproteobacteria bacterium]MDE2346098.1 type II secretion system inner membrane protein GspF [Gammaproteobacteria bacterium]